MIVAAAMINFVKHAFLESNVENHSTNQAKVLLTDIRDPMLGLNKW